MGQRRVGRLQTVPMVGGAGRGRRVLVPTLKTGLQTTDD